MLYPQLQEIDFRQDVPKLEVPVYLVTGKYEARGRAVLAQEWFAMLEAPSKESLVFARSGHRSLFEEPAAVSYTHLDVYKRQGGLSARGGGSDAGTRLAGD